MQRLLLALLLFSSPVLAEKYTIYTTKRAPFSLSGIIDADKTFYFFTNADVPKCDIYGGDSGKFCFVKTSIKAKIIRKGIIKVEDSYYCSEDHIKARNKSDPKPFLTRSGKWVDFGYGECTKEGWVTRSRHWLSSMM